MNDMTQQWKAMQRMMWGVPGSDALQDNVSRFWTIQDRLLNIMENFADGWFERHTSGVTQRWTQPSACAAPGPRLT